MSDIVKELYPVAELIEDMSHDVMAEASKYSDRVEAKVTKYGEAVMDYVIKVEAPSAVKDDYFTSLDLTTPTLFPEELAEQVGFRTEELANIVGESIIYHLCRSATGFERTLNRHNPRLLRLPSDNGTIERMSIYNFARKVWAPDYSERLAAAWLEKQQSTSLEQQVDMVGVGIGLPLNTGDFSSRIEL